MPVAEQTQSHEEEKILADPNHGKQRQESKHDENMWASWGEAQDEPK